MTNDFACDGDIALTGIEVAGPSDVHVSGIIGVIGWGNTVIECDDYVPMRETVGGTGDDRNPMDERMPKPTPEAEERARKLLMKFLGKRRFEKAEKSGFIDIASKLYDGRIYRIPFRGGRIQVEENGKRIEALCFFIRKDALPLGDRVLAKALFAEYDEEELLRIANHMSPDPTVFANEGYGECDAG